MSLQQGQEVVCERPALWTGGARRDAPHGLDGAAQGELEDLLACWVRAGGGEAYGGPYGGADGEVGPEEEPAVGEAGAHEEQAEDGVRRGVQRARALPVSAARWRLDEAAAPPAAAAGVVLREQRGGLAGVAVLGVPPAHRCLAGGRAALPAGSAQPAGGWGPCRGCRPRPVGLGRQSADHRAGRSITRLATIMQFSLGVRMALR